VLEAIVGDPTDSESHPVAGGQEGRVAVQNFAQPVFGFAQEFVGERPQARQEWPLRGRVAEVVGAAMENVGMDHWVAVPK